jgi:hypothetical protein
MTQQELDALVEAKLADRLAARLQADREAVRSEVIRELRREADREWYNRVNKKAPIEDRYSGLGPEGYAARDEFMRQAARKTYAAMDEANARWAERDAAERKAEAARRTPRASLAGTGGEGFKIKPIGGA